jgi:hypothetical protein
MQNGDEFHSRLKFCRVPCNNSINEHPIDRTYGRGFGW